MASARVLPASYNTHTYGDVTRDYQVGEMATWESDHTIDLSIADKGEVLDCYDDAASFDESGIIVTGATNITATRFRVIRSISGQYHDGTPNNGFTISTTTAATVITLSEGNARVHDLIIIVAANSATACRCLSMNGGDNYFVGCIVKATNAGSGEGRGITIAGNTNPSYAIDCLAFECKTYGFQISAPGTKIHYILNCTGINSTLGFDMLKGPTAGEVVLTNCIGSDNATLDFRSDGLVTETVTYCLSKDTTADDWGGAGNLISKTLTFVNAAGDDWHLAATDTDAIGTGTDLSATFDDDIDFETISGWCIGFDWRKWSASPPDSHSISGISGNRNGMGNIDNISTWNIKKFEFKENEKWQEQYIRPVRRRKHYLQRQAKNVLFV